MRKGFAFSFAFIGAIGAANAQAAECDPVLNSGTFATTEARENFVLNRIWYENIADDVATGSSRNVDSSGNYGAYGGSYSEGRAKSYARSLRKASSENLDLRYSADYLVSSGDKGILDAWLGCMRSKSQPILYFENITSREATLVMKWQNAGNRRDPFEAFLTADIALPPWASFRRSNGTECWRRPTAIQRWFSSLRASTRGHLTTEGCRMTIDFNLGHPAYLSELPISVNTTEGSASARLAPRVRIVEDRQTKAIVLHSEQVTGGYKGHKAATWASWEMDPKLAEQGWVIDPDSLDGVGSQGAAYTTTDGDRFHYCWPIQKNAETGKFEDIKAADHTVDVGVFLSTEREGWALGCNYKATIGIYRLRAVPI